MSRRMSWLLSLLVLVLVWSVWSPVWSPVPAGADVVPTDGTATFTDLTGGGACSFPGEPPDNLHVGLSSAEFGVADVCGAYLDVDGPKGSVRVKVTDHCRNCPPGLIDVTRKAFAQIADVEAGRTPVSYRLVRDPPLPAPISLRISEGSSPWWFQLQVLDHGNPLRGVELASPSSSSGGAWRPLVHTADNHWRASDPGPGDGPFTIRITDVWGNSVTLYDVPLTPGHTHHTVARLYQPPAPPPSSPSSPSSPSPPSSPAAEAPAPEAQPVAAPSAPPTPPAPAGGRGRGGALVSVFVVLAALAVSARLYALRR